MRATLAILLLGAVAVAEPPASDPDASVADAARWVEPRGCASGSYRSRALPVVTEIEEAWKLPFDRIDAPPVHWDGTAYFVAHVGGKPYLVAVELGTGRELAREQLRDFYAPTGVLVWDHMAMLQPDPDQINGYRLDGSKLKLSWIFRGRQLAGSWARPRLPTVHDNEIYCFLGDSLARLRPGTSFPSWTADLSGPGGPRTEVTSRFVGRPAVYGPCVFAAWYGEPFQTTAGLVSNLYLTVWRRSDGQILTTESVCQAQYKENEDPGLQLTVTEPALFVGSGWPIFASDGWARQVILPRKGDVAFGTPGLWDSVLPPAQHDKVGALLMSKSDRYGSKDLELCAARDGAIYCLAEEKDQPDLFRDRVTPTVLGDVVYFGSWAADVETGEILWRLPFQHVTFPVVPADHMILVVEDGKVLRAFRGRGLK
jgi:hypothetical protein